LPWMIFAAAVWLLTGILVRLRGIKRLWSAALWAVLIGFYYNWTFTAGEMYRFEGMFYPVEGIPLGYLVAMAAIGILLFHYLPESKVWKFFYLLLFSFILSFAEWYAVGRGLIIYTGWSTSQGLVFKFLALAAVLWLSDLTITRRRGYLFR